MARILPEEYGDVTDDRDHLGLHFRSQTLRNFPLLVLKVLELKFYQLSASKASSRALTTRSSFPFLPNMTTGLSSCARCLRNFLFALFIL